MNYFSTPFNPEATGCSPRMRFMCLMTHNFFAHLIKPEILRDFTYPLLDYFRQNKYYLFGRTAILLLVSFFITNSVNAQTTKTFNFTGAMETYTVPAGVTGLTVKLYGAAGKPGTSSSSGVQGGSAGKGAYVEATITVTPGATINVFVGGNGGYNGGGAAGGTGAGNGGGASDIRIGGTALSNRVLVAGGGGGGGNPGGLDIKSTGNPFGGGGGNSNNPGVDGGTFTADNGSTPVGAKGGTIGAGGAAGLGCSLASGTAGNSTGSGGAGATCCAGNPHGGGGGGGFVNGGGGGGGSAGTVGCSYNSTSGGGGGAGGSNYTTGATNVTVTDGFQSGDGSIVITTIPCATVTPSVSIAVSPSNKVTSGTNVTFTATPTNGGVKRN